MLNRDIIFSENLEDFLGRSANNNDCSLIIYCKSGKMQIEINDRQYLIGANDLLLCRPELIIGNYLRSPDMKCSLIAIYKHALDDIFYVCMREDNKWWEKTQYLLQNPVIHLGERQQELCLLFNRLFELYNEDSCSGLSENIRRIFVMAAVMELLNWLEESVQITDKAAKRGRQEVLFREFIRLLQETKGRQREVRWFADKMAITPKYLSVICNSVSGKSALNVINDVAIQEIKRLLRQSDMSVKEISAEMNFASLSFFCKYIKQHLGITAHQFRRNNR